MKETQHSHKKVRGGCNDLKSQIGVRSHTSPRAPRTTRSFWSVLPPPPTAARAAAWERKEQDIREAPDLHVTESGFFLSLPQFRTRKTLG